MTGTTADLPVLRAVLRTASADPDRLAELLGEPASRVRSALARLADDGFLVRTAEGDSVPAPPARPVLAVALAAVREQLIALDQVRSELESTPSRLRHWAVARSDETEVRIELTHGPDAVGEAWSRLCDPGRAVDAFGCFPDPAALAGVDPELTRRALVSGSRVRLVVGRADAGRAGRVELAALHTHGVEVRTLESAPGWFAGEGDDRSAFPTAWGVRRPLSVRLVPDPTASRALRSLFDELWDRAAPLDALEPIDEPHDWEPVLRLLERGSSDAEVAAELGMSERTVRRRVEDAMIDLGATDRFTLGRAWAARR